MNVPVRKTVHVVRQNADGSTTELVGLKDIKQGDHFTVVDRDENLIYTAMHDAVANADNEFGVECMRELRENKKKKSWFGWLTIFSLFLLVACGQSRCQDFRQIVWHAEGGDANGIALYQGIVSECLPLQIAESRIPSTLLERDNNLVEYFRLIDCGTAKPTHAKRRACINFTASWCDDTYSNKDVYEVFTTGMRVFHKDKYGNGNVITTIAELYEAGAESEVNNVPVRYPYTACIAYMDRFCDVSYYPKQNLCRQIYEIVKESGNLNVLVRLGRFQVEQLKSIACAVNPRATVLDWNAELPAEYRDHN